MAKIVIEGKVARLFFGDKGVEIHEQIDLPNGMSFVKKYTAWFNDPVRFKVGDFGTFTGFLKAKIEDWVDQTTQQPKLDKDGKPGRSIKFEVTDAQFELPLYATKLVERSASTLTPPDDLPF